ncbi:hypothetical protein [Leifsonia sp. Leaf264]|nr:hypothetical protein [Leifsonia sp. Leaf264]
MKIIATVASSETQRIEVEATDYERGLADARSQVPEGWHLISIRVQR